MKPKNVQQLPVDIVNSLTLRVGEALDRGDLGELYLLQGWRNDAYNNNVFLNSYIFGVPQADFVEIKDRLVRTPVPSEGTGEPAALSLVLNSDLTTEWMLRGPGRYAVASQVPLIRAFFEDSSALAPRSEPYSFREVAVALGDPDNFYSVSFYATDIYDTFTNGAANPDWITRSNTHGRKNFVVAGVNKEGDSDFQSGVAEEIQFYVPTSLQVERGFEKRIESMSLYPDVDDVGYTSSGAVDLINIAANRSNFDPYVIGSDVRFIFSGPGREYATYNRLNYESDNRVHDLVTAEKSEWIYRLGRRGPGFTTELREGNLAVRYFEDDRHVIYGTPGEDDLSPFDLLKPSQAGGNLSTLLNGPYHPAEALDPVGVAQGFTLVGGDGDDRIYGFAQWERLLVAANGARTGRLLLPNVSVYPFGPLINDKLYGGQGEDTLVGDIGSDELHGGDDSDVLFGATLEDVDDEVDTLYGGKGQDLYYVGNGDIVVDENESTTGGIIVLQTAQGLAVTLTGGFRKNGDPENLWVSDDGEITYQLDVNEKIITVSGYSADITIKNIELSPSIGGGQTYLGMTFLEEPDMSPALPDIEPPPDTALEVNWQKKDTWLQEASDSGLSTKETIQQYGRYADTYGWLNSWQSQYTHTREHTDEFIDVTYMPPGTYFPFSNIEGGPGDSIILGDDNRNRITDNWQIPEFDGFFPQLLTRNQYDATGGINPDPKEGDIDIIDGGGGDDWLISSYGNDLLMGGEGDDTLQSGFGLYPYEEKENFKLLREWVYESPAQSSRDTLYGGAGNDRLYADADENRLFGEEGNDMLVGGADKDELYGGSGEDYLNGDLYFKKYNEYVEGGFIIGADPSNELERVGDDHLDAGEGDDQATGGGGGDWIYGRQGNDILIGDDPGLYGEDYFELNEAKHGDDHLFGGEGDDVVAGSGGSDELFGGSGNDALIGDRVDDGRDDALAPEYHGADNLYGGEGSDFIIGDGANDELHGGSGNDTLIGDDYADSDRLSRENHGNDTLYGDSGSDYLRGSGGNDTLYGGTGNDVLYGDDKDASESSTVSDNDIFEGGSGSDWMYGQSGNDTYRFYRGDGYDAIVDTDGDDDTVELGLSSDSSSWFRSGSNLIMNAGGDGLYVEDYFGSNSIESFEFSDGVTFTGFDVQESLFSFGGSAGIDILKGNARSTVFDGQEGDDEISPGGGNDQIDGGDGDDKVIFAGLQSDYDIDVVSATTASAASLRSVAMLRQRTVQATNPDVFVVPDGAQVIVTDLLGDEGRNTIINVEQLVFANEAENNAPIANPDTFSTLEDQVLEIDVKDLVANDSDIDNGILKITAVESVSGGSVQLDNGGKISFTPDGEFSGEAIFRYTLIDRQGGEAQTEVTVEVVDVNDNPVFSGSLADISIKATTELSFSIPADQFTDAESGSLTFGVLQADTSDLPAWLSFDSESLTLSGTPPEEKVGALELSVIVVDEDLGFTSVALNLEVTTSILPPELVGDSVAGTEDVIVDIAFDTLTDNDTDPDGDPLIIDSVDNAVNGVAELTPAGVRFTPDQDFAGEASFEYHVTKTNGLSDSAVVTLQISAVNDAPVVGFVQPDQDIDAGRQFLFTMPDDLFVDVDGDELSYSATLADGSALPSWIEYVSAGSKDPGYFVGRLEDRSGTDITVRVTATDGSESEFQDFQISAPAVDNLPPLPLQNFLAYSTENASTFEIPLESLLFAVVDPDDDALSVVSITAVDGTAQIVGDTVQVTADTGIASFDYVVEDEAGNTVDLGAEVLFEETNQPPQYFGLNPESDFRVRAGSLFQEEFSTFDFFDDNTVALKLSATLENGDPLPAWLQVIFDQQSGSLRLTGRPAESDVGEISVAINAIDNQLASTPVVYQLAVYPEVNVDPVAVADSLTAYEDEILEVSSAELLDNDSDPEKAELNIVDVGNAVGGTVELVVLGEQKVVFTPEEDYNSERNGAAGFEYTLSDGEGGSTIGQADIDIRPVVDFEVKTGAFIEPQQAVAGEEFLFAIPDNTLYHPDGDPVQLTVTMADGSAAPEWVEIDSDSRVLRAVPSADAVGDLELTLSGDTTLGYFGFPARSPLLLEIQANDSALPVAVTDNYDLQEDEVLDIESRVLLENDTGNGSDPLTVVSVGNAINGRVTLKQGQIEFTPSENYSGLARFNYTAQAADGTLSVAAVELQIESVDDPLTVIEQDVGFIVNTGAFSIPMPALFTDADSDQLAYEVTMSDGSALPAWLKYIPGDGEKDAGELFGNVQSTGDIALDLNITATTPTGDNASWPVALNVTGSQTNLAPVAGSDRISAVAGAPAALAIETLLANDIDPERQALTFNRVVEVTDGTVELIDGTLSVVDGGSGSARFSYAVTDDQGAESIQWVDVNFRSDDRSPQSIGTLSTKRLYAWNSTSYWALPGFTFSHPDNDTLSVEATLEDGSPLPDWLTFIDQYSAEAGQDAQGNILPNDYFGSETKWIFSAILPKFPDAVPPALNVKITATDPDGDQVSVMQEVTLSGSFDFSNNQQAEDRFYTRVNEPIIIADTDLFNNDGFVYAYQAFVSNEENGRARAVTDFQFEAFKYVEFYPETDFIGTASFDLDLAGRESTVYVEIEGPNRPPAVSVDDATIQAGEESIIALAPNAITDPDNDELDVDFTQADGSVLPGWIVFDSGSNSFVANPPIGSDGALEIVATAIDPDGLSASDTFTVNVVPVENLAPIAEADELDANVGVVRTFSASELLVNDFDPEGGALEVIAVDAENTNGSVELVDGTINYLSDDENVRSDTFYYTIADDQGANSTAPVIVDIDAGDFLGELTVTPSDEQTNKVTLVDPVDDDTPDNNGTSINVPVAENQPPVANDDQVAAIEDQTSRIPVSALLQNDTDDGAESPTVVSVENRINGTVVLEGEEVVFTPDENFNGDSSFEYTISDDEGAQSIASVTVMVAPVNDAPIAVDDAFGGAEDEELNIAVSDLLSNDTDIDDSELTVVSVADPVNGTVELQGVEVVFTPDADFNGEATFSYTIEDAAGASSSATARIDVAPVNDAPVAVDDAFNGTEDEALNIAVADLLSNDTDIDDSALTVVSVADPVNGTVELQGDEVVFTPDADFNGEASFSYTIEDAAGATSSATARIDVAPVNDAPIAADDAFSGTEDEALSIAVSDLLSNDIDIDVSELTVVSVADPVNGTVELQGDEVVFIPDADFNGEATFSYTIEDAAGASASATARIDVAPVNDAPIAADDAFNGTEDEMLSVGVADLLSNDTDIDDSELTVVSVADPVNGTVELQGDEVVFTPDADFNGEATFSYTIEDAAGATSSATARIDVAPVNDAPVAVDDAFLAVEDEVRRINVTEMLANDTDVDGDVLSVVSVGGAENGLVELDGDEVVFTPSANYHGPAEFSYTVEDEAGAQSSATVNLTVLPVNDDPLANDDSFDGIEDEVRRITVAELLANDTDIDGDDLTVISVGGAQSGSVELVGNEVFFTPNGNYNGPARFNYTIEDAAFAQASAVVNLNIAPVNDDPIAADDQFTGMEDESLQISVNQLLANDTDIDGDNLVVAAVSAPENGTVVLEGDTVTFTPDANYSGAAVFDYTIEDTAGAQSSATVNLTIEPDEEDPIVIDPLDDIELEDCKPFHYQIPVVVQDADQANLQYSLQSSDGSALPGWLTFDSDTLVVSGTPPIGETTSLGFTLTVIDGTDTAQAPLTINVAGAEINGITKSGNWRSNRIYGGSKNDSLSGGYGNDLLLGKSGDDLLSGDSGHDVLKGGTGDDRILGGDGCDTIYGQRGNDKVHAGAHNDRYYDWYGDNCADGGSGHDVLKTGHGRDHLRGGTGNDLIYGGGGDDRLFGDAGSDRLFGQYGNDFLKGGDGCDLLKDYDGHNELYGGADRDYLFSGNGNDKVSGGTGDDVINAGRGDDTYLYSLGDGRDLVCDHGGNDTLRLSGLSSDDVTYKRKYNDLYVLATDDGYIRVQNWFKHHGRIESVEFDNGEVINTEDIYRLVDSITRFDGQASASDGISGMLSDDDDQGVMLAA